MTKYTRVLKSIKIERELLHEVFKFKGRLCIGLNKEKYHDILCDKILENLSLTVCIQWGNDKKKSIIIDFYCASKQCKLRLKVIINKIDVNLQEDVILKVNATENKCNHCSEKLIRPLKGDERKAVAIKVKNSSVDQHRNDAIIISNKESLKKRMLQKVYTKPVLRKAVSDLNSENDTSVDPIYDIFLQANKLKFVLSIKCIRMHA